MNIFIYPNHSQYNQRNFLFRISSATITKMPSLFTQFENYKRYLIMLDNHLSIIRNQKAEEYKKLEIFTFDSNDNIESLSLGTDFNLMVSKRIKNSSLIFDFNLKDNHDADYLFIFSLASTDIKINQEKYFLKELNLLVIHNKSRQLLDISVNQKSIIGAINIHDLGC